MAILRTTIFGHQKWSFIAEMEYQAILDQATLLGFTKPPKKEQYYQNNLVKELKVSGTWEKLDEFYVFSHSAGIPFSTINWIHPTRQITRLVTNPLHSYNIAKNGYYAYGGSLLHFSSTYNPSVMLENYKLNDASFGYVIYMQSAELNSGVQIVSGSNVGATRRAFVRESISRVYFQRGTSFLTISGLSFPNYGLLKAFSLKADSLITFQDSAKIATTASVVTDIDVDLNFRYINMGTDGAGSSVITRMMFVGGSLSDLQHTDLYNSWNYYFNKIQ